MAAASWVSRIKPSTAVGRKSAGRDPTVLFQLSNVPLGHRGIPQTPQLLLELHYQLDAVEKQAI